MTTLKQNKEYAIEYRIFKDMTWFKGWFKGLKPYWAEWENWKDYDSLEELQKDYNILETKRPYLAFRTEYRIVKK